MRILYSLLLSAVFCLALNAQTVWTGDVDSDWMNAGNWSAGVPTSGSTVTIPGTPQGGNFPVYSGSPVLDFTIQNAGSITFDDFVYNNGTIINFTSGTLVNNNNYFVNAGSVVFDNDGNFTNSGTFENFGTFDNAATATFDNIAGASLINHGIFKNNGLLDNHGSIVNYGDLRSTNNVQNSGTIENHGVASNPFGSVYTNAANGVINNQAGGEFSHNGTFQNDGNINNSGLFEVRNAGVFTNDATITNDSELMISGNLLNNQTINNNSTTTINDAGTLDNKNNFANNATVVTTVCGVIIQDSPIDIAASVLHDGIIYEMQGNVDETILEFGEVFNDLAQTKPPVPGCEAGLILQLDENGEATLTAEEFDKGSYGQCGATIASRFIDRTEFTTADLGSQTVVLTVTDNLGLTNICDNVITVVEYVPPIVAVDDPDIEFSCPDDITVTGLPGQQVVAVDWTEPTDVTTTCAGTGEECASRTASNTTHCNSGTVYGFYFKFEGLNYYYSVSNGIFTEYEDGTANYSGLATNLGDSNYQLDLNINFSGRTFATPSGSPKSNNCGSENDSEWYYYTETSGTLTGAAGLEGASIMVTRFGESFQVGDGANVTGAANEFGASGWLDGTVVSQPTSGPVLTINYNGNNNAGDINIMLSGDGNECRPMTQCSEVDEDISGFIFLGEYNNSKYYCSNTSNWTWANAKAEAEANGGHLAIVDDIAENDFLQDGMIASYAWIGLSDEETEGTFKWVDGQDATFVNWSSGEPNNSGGVEDYVRLLKSTGKWTDRDEWFEAEFIMEISCSNEPQSCADVSDDKPGFTYLGEFNSAKYYVSDHASDWGYAKSNSEANGGHLVVINDAAENDFILAGINPASGSIWTGLNTVYSPNVFNWINNDPVNYTNWQAGEPNGNGLDQAARMKKADGLWTDRGAYSYSYEYVMEIPCDDTPPPPPPSSDPVVQQIGGPPNGGDFIVGVTEVAYQVTDDCGNLEVCIFNVTVEENPVDITVTCPENIVVDAAPGAETATVSWTVPSGVSGCYIPGVAVERADPEAANGGEFEIGTVFIAYALTDSCGNFVTCSFAVTVNAQDPVLTLESCPGDFTTESENFTWDLPTGTSNCFSGNVVVEQVQGPEIGSNPGDGVYQIVYLLNDDCGNSEVCVFDVTVAPTCAPAGDPCDDGNDCTVNDVEDGDCGCAGTYVDSDGDGVCDADDICEGGDDNVDTDGDGTPDFCDDCNFVAGDSCDDGDDCTTGDVYDANCGCAGTFEDTDGDGVCNADDICEGGDDNVDTDGDGTPDFCDDCNFVAGDSCDDGDDCTTGDVYDANCGCAGTFEDTDGDGVCNADDICEGGDDNVDTDGDGTPDYCDDCNFEAGDSCDDGDDCTTGDVYDANCGCAGTFEDTDGDGVCNADDICEGGDDNVDTDGDGSPDYCDDCNFEAGDSCDDGNDCTTGDVYDANCGCAGTYVDSDGDGVCDADDICEGGDDNVDTDGDGIPDFCDTANCDNITDGGIIDGNETGCFSYDPSEITSVTAASGGSGDLEYIWLSSTDGCPNDLAQTIPGATGATFDPGVITQTTYYLRCARRGGCVIYPGESNCITKTVDNTDSDGDGVCDAEDICDGGDDNMDTDGDGTPNFCDDTPGGGGDPCEDIVITAGSGSITVSNVNAPIFNVFIFNSSWGMEYNCNFTCTDPTSVDLAPGTYYVKVTLKESNWADICEIFETYEVTEGCANNPGDPCDDGDDCTTGDVYDADCGCAGTFADDDGDGVCDADDVCAGFDDNADDDNDGIPNGCDTNECDNVTNGGEIAGDETGCAGYDPAMITIVSAPTGGSGPIEYIWLSSTSSCPTQLSQTIPGATGATYNPGVITETTYFVRCSRRADCDDWTVGESNCVIKTVDNTDTDGDGVCDLEDICEGGDDNMDNDGDGTPNFCDDTPDGGGDPCENIVITAGSGSITVSNVDAPIFNVFIFNSSWGMEYNCNFTCTDPTTVDLAPGTYYVKVSLKESNWTDICEIFETYEVTEGCANNPGDPCDDGDDCTTGDVYDADCGCAGTFADDDGDGVCDADDICPGYDDNADADGDTIPDGCDSNECDNVTDGGSIVGDEAGCSGYDPAMISVGDAPSGGSGPVEYLWLSSTSSCPTSLNQAIPGAVSATYDPGAITETTYFVRCSRRADCDDWTQGESNCIIKTVDDTDSDGDGVCDLNDVCAGGDDNMDNDGDGTPNYCDDTPDGGGDPCENIVITAAAGSITVSNVDAAIFNVFIFNSQWGMEYNCNFACTDPTTVELDPGFYHVKVTLKESNWSDICEIFETYEVTGGQGYVASEEILDFHAVKNGREVRTYWITNSEVRNDYFIVERSFDGINFEELLEINSVTDNFGPFNYFESDLNPAFGENFYRLKKVHKDGSFDYSVAKRVVFDLDLSETAVFPNPATQEVYIDLQDFEGRSATVSIFNHLGQRMDVKVIDVIDPNPIRFDLSGYTGGAYTIYIDMEGTKNFARKFIVSRL